MTKGFYAIALWAFMALFVSAGADEDTLDWQNECVSISAFDVEYALPCGLSVSHKDGSTIFDNLHSDNPTNSPRFKSLFFAFGEKDERFFDFERYALDHNKKVVSCAGVDVMLIDNVTSDGLSVGIAYDKDIYLLFMTMSPEYVKKFFKCT